MKWRANEEFFPHANKELFFGPPNFLDESKNILWLPSTKKKRKLFINAGLLQPRTKLVETTPTFLYETLNTII